MFRECVLKLVTAFPLLSKDWIFEEQGHCDSTHFQQSDLYKSASLWSLILSINNLICPTEFGQQPDKTEI